MENYLKVESEDSLVRDVDSNAIVNQNQSEFDKFLELSQRKYQEKKKFDDMRSDLDSLKEDITLLAFLEPTLTFISDILINL